MVTLQQRNFGHDRLLEQGPHAADPALHLLQLHLVFAVDAAAVLRAAVRALAVAAGGVVHGKEDLQDLLQRDHLRVERHPHHLGIAGIATAEAFVIHRGGVAVGIAAFHGEHPAHIEKDGLGAPEAAAGQGDDGGSRRHSRVPVFSQSVKARALAACVRAISPPAPPPRHHPSARCRLSACLRSRCRRCASPAPAPFAPQIRCGWRLRAGQG